MTQPADIVRPSKADLGRIAERQPELLNLLVAYFVFEWRVVKLGRPALGNDQTGCRCLIPNYIGMWTDDARDGIDVAVHYLLLSPKMRRRAGPGYLTEFLAGCV